MSQLSDKVLQDKLNEALEKEDYEEAALIRDEMKRRNPHS